ncbi:MAG: RHS repeat-associated core domain-containing protein [Acidobacteriaceae bacterium]
MNRVTEAQQPINGSPETTTYTYNGDTTTIADFKGNTSTLNHDASGRLRQTTDPLGYSIILGYDPAGTKTSVTDSLGHTLWSGTYAYGIGPILVSEYDVDRGTWTYSRDALGEPTSFKNGNNQNFYLQWDSLGRLVALAEPGLYTLWSYGGSAANHNVDRLANVCTYTGYPCNSSYYYNETDTYDSFGRPYQRSISIPAIGTNTFTWTYSSTTGLLDTLTYPVTTSGNPLKLQYSYQNGILKSIADFFSSALYWQADAQNPAGEITQETLGNGVVTSRTYDDVTHWLKSVESSANGNSIQDLQFTYDLDGNVTERQDYNRGLTEDFYYDNDNRLSYSNLTSNGNSGENLSLSYDQMGNITSRSDVAGGASWTYDPVHIHEVTQAGNSTYKYTYDADGNMTSRQGSSITWAGYDYPTVINDTTTGESVSISYGPDRRAYMEQTQGPSGTEVAYHVGGLLDIVSAGGVTDYRHYIYAGTEPVAIASRESSGTNALYYFLTDHQGSVNAILNSAGGIAVAESFSAYGSRRDPSSWSGTPSGTDLSTIAGITRHGYTFQEALGSQMGLNDMVGRVQDAVIGRFMSADPNVPDPSNPQSYNPYSYTINNPVTRVDPTGFLDGYCSPPTSSDQYDGGVCGAPPGTPGGQPGDIPVRAPPMPAPCVVTSCTTYYPDPTPNVSPPTWSPPPATGPSVTPTPPGKSPGSTQITCNGKSCDQQQEETFEQCVSGGGGPQGSGENTFQQGLGYADVATTALEGTTDSLLDSSSLTLGKAMAGASPFGALNAPTNAGYEALGSQVQSALGPVATGLKLGGYTLGALGVLTDAYSGYNTGGVAGAATGAGFGLIDFGVESTLAAAGPFGAAAAIGFSAIGGSKTIAMGTGTGIEIIGCNAKLGYPLPQVYRQIR